MGFKTFISDLGDFSLLLPVKWVEYGGEDGIYSFVDLTEWSGNLSVTQIRFVEEYESSTLNYIERVYQNTRSKNSVKSKIGNQHCISFSECVDKEGFITYYWFLEKGNFVFVFSFSTDKENSGTVRNELELKKMENIICSIKTVEWNRKSKVKQEMNESDIQIKSSMKKSPKNLGFISKVLVGTCLEYNSCLFKKSGRRSIHEVLKSFQLIKLKENGYVTIYSCKEITYFSSEVVPGCGDESQKETL